MTSPRAQADLAVLIEMLVFRLLTAGAEFWACVDLTMPQLKVLFLLGRHGSAPVSWLASSMKVSPPNITGILDRLEQHNWVERTSDSKDRRVVRIRLTAEGAKLLHDLVGAGITQLREAIGSFAHDNVSLLSSGLVAFLDSLDEYERNESGRHSSRHSNGGGSHPARV